MVDGPGMNSDACVGDLLGGLADLGVDRHGHDEVDPLARNERAGHRVRVGDRHADGAEVGPVRIEVLPGLQDREGLSLGRGGEQVLGHELPGRHRHANDSPEDLVERPEGGLVRRIGGDRANADVALLDRLARRDLAGRHDDVPHLHGGVLGRQPARAQREEHGRCNEERHDDADADVDL